MGDGHKINSLLSFNFYEVLNEFFAFFRRCWKNIKMNNFDFVIKRPGIARLSSFSLVLDLTVDIFKPFNLYAINGSDVSFGRVHKSCEFYDCTVLRSWNCCFGQMTAKCYHTEKSVWLAICRRWILWIYVIYTKTLQLLPTTQFPLFILWCRFGLPRTGFCHFFSPLAIIPSNRLAIQYFFFMESGAVMMMVITMTNKMFDSTKAKQLLPSTTGKS